jgi:hypothetical protein
MGGRSEWPSRGIAETWQLCCVECGALSGSEARGWRGYRCLEPETDLPELAFYCAECAAREFDEA